MKPEMRIKTESSMWSHNFTDYAYVNKGIRQPDIMEYGQQLIAVIEDRASSASGALLEAKASKALPVLPKLSPSAERDEQSPSGSPGARVTERGSVSDSWFLSLRFQICICGFETNTTDSSQETAGVSGGRRRRTPLLSTCS